VIDGDGPLLADLQALSDAMKKLDRLRDAFAAGVEDVQEARDAVEDRTAQLSERVVERGGVEARIEAIQQLLGGRDVTALRQEVATLRDEIARLEVEQTTTLPRRATGVGRAAPHGRQAHHHE